MKFCNNCNREYADNLNFCSKCGGTLNTKPQEYFCPSCGKSLGESFDRFCPYCGCQFGQVQDTSEINSSTAQVNNINSNSFNQSINYKATAHQTSTNGGYASKGYLFSFKGRRGRLEGVIIETILSILLFGIILGSDGIGHSPLGYILFVVGIAVFGAKLANSVKRVHDFDKSGLWLFGCFVIYSIVMVFIKNVSSDLWLLITLIAPYLIYIPKGTNGPNKYGL